MGPGQPGMIYIDTLDFRRISIQVGGKEFSSFSTRVNQDSKNLPFKSLLSINLSGGMKMEYILFQRPSQ
jgi:hypothetical protein